MIQKTTKRDCASSPSAGSEATPNEIVKRIARKMLDLHFCGTLVNAEALASHGFTIKEINEHWEAARDEAIIMERENNRAA